jgi:hypothetical protein
LDHIGSIEMRLSRSTTYTEIIVRLIWGHDKLIRVPRFFFESPSNQEWRIICSR